MQDPVWARPKMGARTNLWSSAKNAVSKIFARNRMTSASGLAWVSPRAAAHVWGKGARIPTEINRLPHHDRISKPQIRREEVPRAAVAGVSPGPRSRASPPPADI